MSERPSTADGQRSNLGRRDLLVYTAALGTTMLAGQGLSRSEEVKRTKPRRQPIAGSRRYDMKKSINMWAFPYPDRWSLKECLQLAKDAGLTVSN